MRDRGRMFGKVAECFGIRALTWSGLLVLGIWGVMNAQAQMPQTGSAGWQAATAGTPAARQLTLAPLEDEQYQNRLDYPIPPKYCRWQPQDAPGPCSGEDTTCRSGMCASTLVDSASTSRDYFDSVYMVQELPGTIGMAVRPRFELRPCWEDRKCIVQPFYGHDCEYTGSGIWYCKPNPSGGPNCYLHWEGDVIETEHYDSTILQSCFQTSAVVAHW